MTRTQSGNPAIRSGFTLVELLVVISIIGILMGLLIPAVNAARETARRNQCSTQINNLAKAAIQYEMSHKSFPGWVNDFGNYIAPGGPPFDPSDPENATDIAVSHKKIGSWVVSLLPSLDAQPTYEIWTQDKYPLFTGADTNRKFTINSAPNLAIMQCPSSPSLTGERGRNSYVANHGMYHLDGPIGGMGSSQPVQRSTNDNINGGTPFEMITFMDAMKKDNGVFNNRLSANNQAAAIGNAKRGKGPDVRIDDIKDGQGNTVLFSENLQAIQWNQLHPDRDDPAPSTQVLIQGLAITGGKVMVNYPVYSQLTQGFVWHYRDMKGKAFNGSQSATDVMHINGLLNGRDLYIDSMTVANAHHYARPSSAHSDGVNMGFADGSSKFVSQSIDYRTYQALMTPRGKSSDVPFRQYVLQGESL